MAGCGPQHQGPPRRRIDVVRVATIAGVLLLSIPCVSLGQSPTATPVARGNETAASGASASPAHQNGTGTVGGTEKPPRVVRVRGSGADQTKVSLNESIHVYLDSLPENVEASAYVLHINGLPIAGLPVWSAQDPGSSTYHLAFHIVRNSNSDAALTKLAIKAWQNVFKNNFEPQFAISVGKSDGPAGPTDVAGTKGFKIILVNQRWFEAVAVGSVALFIALIAMAAYSDAFRDKTPEPQVGRRPFSLARCQMAWWFFLSLMAYMLIYLVTGNSGAFSDALLGLIGISASTGLASVAVDSSKRTEMMALRDKLNADKARVVADIAQHDAAIADIDRQLSAQPSADNAAALQREKAEKTRQRNDLEQQRTDTTDRITKLDARFAPASQHFLIDVLSDEDGVSLNRLQIFVWTIVLGIIFVAQVWQQLSMPEFSSSVLALMGLRSEKRSSRTVLHRALDSTTPLRGRPLTRFVVHEERVQQQDHHPRRDARVGDVERRPVVAVPVDVEEVGHRA
jgi:hypothetical protein